VNLKKNSQTSDAKNCISPTSYQMKFICLVAERMVRISFIGSHFGVYCLYA